jgi:hypothetical protein
MLQFVKSSNEAFKVCSNSDWKFCYLDALFSVLICLLWQFVMYSVSVSRWMSSVLQNGCALGQKSVGLRVKTANQILLWCPLCIIAVHRWHYCDSLYWILILYQLDKLDKNIIVTVLQSHLLFQTAMICELSELDLC